MVVFTSARIIGLICVCFALLACAVYADTPLYTDSNGQPLSSEFAISALSSYVDSSGNPLSNEFNVPSISALAGNGTTGAALSAYSRFERAAAVQ